MQSTVELDFRSGEGFDERPGVGAPDGRPCYRPDAPVRVDPQRALKQHGGAIWPGIDRHIEVSVVDPHREQVANWLPVLIMIDRLNVLLRRGPNIQRRQTAFAPPRVVFALSD